MPSYEKSQLGRLVRQLREQRGMTQEALGREAGYRSGAGVSISRLENGLLEPGPERLAGIAAVFGMVPDELIAQAVAQVPKVAPGGLAGPGGEHDQADAPGGAPPGQRELNLRKIRIEAEVERRTQRLTALADAFNTQHDRARDEFFMEFVAYAEALDGAPIPTNWDGRGEEASGSGEQGADTVAGYRLDTCAHGVAQALAAGAGGAAAGAAVGGAAAYATFVAASSLGTASTGAAISGLTGIAASNATFALLGGGTLAAGGAGVAGGTMVLAGIVAAPAVLLFAGGLAWMVKRNRKQRQEFARMLDEAEAQVAATAAGVEALCANLGRAEDLLGYIATHGGHSLRRWRQRVGGGSVNWDDLDTVSKDQYHGFVEVAAAQVAVVSFDYASLLTPPTDMEVAPGGEPSEAVEGELVDPAALIDELLRQAEAVVRAHV